MSTTLPVLTPTEDSLFLTLCGRALDNRSPRPVLGDALADQIVRTLGYDHGRLHIDTDLRLNIALRAKKLDEVTRAFLARHPDAVGLDLGAGLDTRHARIAPPPTVEWFDVDLPAVAEARRRLVPERPHAHVVAADVTHPEWLDGLPADRPVIVVADGLMGFLSENELITLFDRVVDHFPSGELVFNSYSRFAVWAVKHSRGTRSVADLLRFPGFDDPRVPERWNPRLHLVREILLAREPEIASYPRVLRLYYGLLARRTSWARKGTIILHYRF